MIILAIAVAAITASARAVTIDKPGVYILDNAERRIAIETGEWVPYGGVYYIAIEECDSVSEIKVDLYDTYVEVNGHKVRVDRSAIKANKATHYEVVAGDLLCPRIEYVVYNPTLTGKKIRVKKLSRKYCK